MILWILKKLKNKNIFLPILWLFIAGLLFSCTPSSLNGKAAEYRLNGNLNDYIKARLANNSGDLLFVGTPFGRGILIDPVKSPGYFSISHTSLSPEGFSISLWLKFLSFTGKQNIFTFTSGDAKGMELYYENGNWRWSSLDGGSIEQVSFPLKTGVYYHLLFTGKGENARLYLNGKLLHSGILPRLPEEGTLIIGAGISGGHLVRAVVDEICLYDYYAGAQQSDSIYRSYQKK